MRWIIATVALVVLSAPGTAQASTFSNIYQFCSQVGCADGGLPAANMVADGAGNYFGTASSGGNENHGVVFELSPSGASWTYSVVYAFCATDGCPDGSLIESPMILDTQGDLFGTTRQGGTGHGTAFELVRTGKSWTFKRLYAFCAQPDCKDGDDVGGSGLAYMGQRDGAAYDGTSPLYGTTYQGGKYNSGTAFSLTPPAPGKKHWKQNVLYDFCKEASPCFKTGTYPSAGVVVDSPGNLYGTTVSGGDNGSGTIFQLADNGKKWKHTVLYSFCAQTRCGDGATPENLVEDDSGALYGAASGGAGQTACGGGGCGALFKLVPNGKNSTYTLLHAFCTSSGCADGFDPSGIQRLANGDIVGVTSLGGSYAVLPQTGAGVLYRLSGSTYSVLHDFCTASGCPDGYFAQGGPVVDASGDILGTTSQGGAGHEGTIFELTP